ncbi:MAG TPA: hypothetical protein VNZ45_00155 [Bacteroidia bacterium]|jgi:hypothetical protein|nr:hypothetical protein [Bacteroidia bacterium]
MKTLLLTISIIALSATGLLAQNKKATQPAQKNQKQVKHKPDSTKTKAADTGQAPMQIPRNKKQKPNTDLINNPGK